jgi:hypothetical protein
MLPINIDFVLKDMQGFGGMGGHMGFLEQMQNPKF